MRTDSDGNEVKMSRDSQRFILSLAEENCVIEDVIFQKVGKEVSGIKEPDTEKEDNINTEEPYLSTTIQIQNLAPARNNLGRHGRLN